MAKAALLVAVVGTLVSLAGPNYRSDPGDQHAAAQAQLSMLASALGTYWQKHGKLPESLQALTKAVEGEWAIMKSVPLDPWGSDYHYTAMEGETFRLRSPGEDGLLDTEDDIVWRNPDDD